MKKISSLLFIVSSINSIAIKTAEEYRIHSKDRPAEGSNGLSAERREELKNEHRDVIREHNAMRNEHKETQKELRNHTGIVEDNDHFKYKADDDEPIAIYDDSSEEHSEAIISLYNQTIKQYNETFPNQPEKKSIHINDLAEKSSTDIAKEIESMHEAIEQEQLSAADQSMRKNKTKIENDFLDQLQQTHEQDIKDKEDAKRKDEQDKLEEQKNKREQQEAARLKKIEADSAKKEAAFKKAQNDAAKEANRLPNVDKNIFVKIKDFFLRRTRTAAKDIVEAFTTAEPASGAKEALRDLSKEQRLEAIKDALIISAKTPADLENAVKKLNEILPNNEQLSFNQKTGAIVFSK